MTLYKFRIIIIIIRFWVPLNSLEPRYSRLSTGCENYPKMT